MTRFVTDTPNPGLRHGGEFFLVENDVLALGVLVSLDDLVETHFTMLGAQLGVMNPLLIRGM
jgi:hypothetical protein